MMMLYVVMVSVSAASISVNFLDLAASRSFFNIFLYQFLRVAECRQMRWMGLSLFLISSRQNFNMLPFSIPSSRQTLFFRHRSLPSSRHNFHLGLLKVIAGSVLPAISPNIATDRRSATMTLPACELLFVVAESDVDKMMLGIIELFMR